MTLDDFADTIGYITLATGAPLSPEAQVVYFDLLGDLPAEALRLGARRVVLEHKYPTSPSVAELRAASVEADRGDISETAPSEAWEQAWRAIGRIDLDIDGSKERGLAGLSSAVLKTINALGLSSLIGGNDPVPVVRAQFIKAYEAIAAREKRERLLPAPVREAIEANARPAVLRLAEAFRTPEAVS
jgi:hypothetical protein